MSQGSKKVDKYYIIKSGCTYLTNVDIDRSMEDDKTLILRQVKFTENEIEARRWNFDSLSKFSDVSSYDREKYFLDVLQTLEDSKIPYKVLKNKITTVEEQKEVSFVDGKEVEPDKLDMPRIYSHIISSFGVEPRLVGKLLNPESETSAFEALKKLNEELEKLKHQHPPEHVKEYIENLEKQIELLEQKDVLLERELKAIKERE